MRYLTQFIAARQAALPADAQQAEQEQMAVSTAIVASSLANVADIYQKLTVLNETTAKAYGMVDEFTQTRAFRDVVAAEGFTRPIVALANADGSAQQIFANFPALETIDAAGIPMKSRRHLEGLAGVDEVLALEDASTQTDIAAVVDATIAAIRVFCDDLEQREGAGQRLAVKLTGATLSDEKLAAAQVTAVKASARKAEIESLTAAATSMAHPAKLDGLTSKDIEGLLEGIKSAVDSLAKSTGLTYADGAVTINSKSIDPDHAPVAGTLAELGYTADGTASLVRQVLALIDVLENLRDNLPAVEAGLRTAIVAHTEAEVHEEAAAATGEEVPPAAATEAEAEPEPEAEGEEEPEAEEAPTPATVQQVASVIYGIGTIVSAVLNSACVAILSVIEIGELVSEMAATVEPESAPATDVTIATTAQLTTVPAAEDLEADAAAAAATAAAAAAEAEPEPEIQPEPEPAPEPEAEAEPASKPEAEAEPVPEPEAGPEAGEAAAAADDNSEVVLVDEDDIDVEDDIITDDEPALEPEPAPAPAV